MSRQTTYNDEVGQELVAAIRTGLPVKFAAALAHVPRATLYRWLERGEAEDAPDSDAPFVAFAQLYREAEAEYVAQELASIDGEVGEGKGDWKRTAWKLEKRFPKEFGTKLALEHSGPNGGAIKIDDARNRILAILARGDDPVAARGDAGSAQQ